MSSVEQIKYHSSPFDDDDGILLVDVETESTPMTDANGRLQYYSLSGGYVYSASDDDDE